MTEQHDFDGRSAWNERRARPSMLRVSRITMLHLGALLSSHLAASLTTSKNSSWNVCFVVNLNVNL